MKKIETNIKDKIYLKESFLKEEIYNKKYEWNIIRVYPYKEKRRWLGLGGSITEASCYNFSLLSEEKQEKFLDSYYSYKGLNYDLGRISIGSNDFCISPYEYTQKEDLSDFSINHDKKYILPMLKKILKKKKISLVASPWTPPKFMKDNKNLFEGGKLLKKYYKLYCEYIIKFLDEYKKEGIDIDYVTIQNEPYATQRWESCNFTLEEQSDFIYNYFLEFLKNKNTKLLLWDHNKENLYEVTKKLYKYNNKIAGIAYHSYTGTHAKNLELVSNEYKELELIHTEGCTAFEKYNEKNWIKDAQIYLIDLITDMNNGANGYIDWNILLNSKGGVTHKDNFCKSPIILNSNNDDYILTPIYYYLYHVANFIKKNFIILDIDIYHPEILAVCAKSEKEIITVVLNKNKYDVEIDLVINNSRTHDNIKANSIVTYIKNI